MKWYKSPLNKGKLQVGFKAKKVRKVKRRKLARGRK